MEFMMRCMSQAIEHEDVAVFEFRNDARPDFGSLMLVEMKGKFDVGKTYLLKIDET